MLQGRAQVAQGRHGVGRGGAQVGEEGAQTGRDRLRRVDERVEVVERRAQVDERRVRLTHEVRQLRDRLGEALLALPDRVHHPIEVPDQGRDVGSALGESAGEVRGIDDQVLERPLVRVQLAEHLARGRQERVQVVESAVGARADPVVRRREPLDHVLEVVDRLRRQRVEELVEVDGRDGLLLRERASVRDRGAGLGVGRNRQLNLATGDLGERRRADGRDRAAPQRRVVVVDAERDLGLAARAELDVAHRADGHAAHDHLVSRDQLARVLELGGDLVVVASGEHDDECDHCDHERDDGRDAADHGAPGHDSPFPNPVTRPGQFPSESTLTIHSFDCQRTTVARIRCSAAFSHHVS